MICLFFIGDVRTSKNFTLKVIIQGLLRLYNKDISFNLTKTKALLKTVTSKITFNIDGLIKYLTLNIPFQQFLFSLSNLSRYSINRLTCQYEQLHIVMIFEISFVRVRMLNVIDNRLRSIKHIQNKFFSDVDALEGKYIFFTSLYN